MTPIIKTLYSEIATIIAGVSNVKESFPHPQSKFTKYPACIYFLTGIENAFSTTSENFKTYKFKIFVLIGVEQTTISNVMGNVLPNTTDNLIQAFDTNWSLTSIDSHRCWATLNGGAISLAQEANGLMGVAELDLNIKISTNN